MKKKPCLDPGKRIVMCIGAHPDDSEFRCCGTAALWSNLGDKVILVSMTDGSAGTFDMSREDIAERRRAEAISAAAIIKAESVIVGCEDGLLEPSVENREKLIRIIRKYSPDIIITNRLNDYHPDHRYTAQLVQDASYMIMVPNVVPDAAPMSFSPVILHWGDDFTEPTDFRPDMVIDIDSIFPLKLRMLAAHASQMFEWLPWVDGTLDEVPVETDVAGRIEWVRKLYSKRPNHRFSNIYRNLLVDRYGDSGARTEECEAFKVCEYGYRPSKDELERIFEGI